MAAPTTYSPDMRVHHALGALSEAMFRATTCATRAAGTDRFGIAADQALSSIISARAHLDDLELGLLALKAEADSKAAA